MTQVNIHINIQDMTLEETVLLRARIQQFLDNEPNAKLVSFQFVEQEVT